MLAASMHYCISFNIKHEYGIDISLFAASHMLNVSTVSKFFFYMHKSELKNVCLFLESYYTTSSVLLVGSNFPPDGPIGFLLER